ncbi:MAG: hypothetical protein ACUVSK_10250 [Desulfotomaculales bacterium]
MKKVTVLFFLVLLSFMFFALPALALESFSAVRNQDGSVTITWTGGKPGKKLTIEYSCLSTGTQWWNVVRDIPQVDGQYIHREPPAEEIKYRLHYGVGAWTPEVTVPAFGSQDNQNDQSTVQIEDEGGMFERAIAEVFNGLSRAFEGIMGAAGLKRINDVLFPASGQQVSLESPPPWEPSRWQLLDKLYLAFFAATFPLCLIVVFLTALKLIRAGAIGNSHDRAEAMETVWRWVFALIIIVSAPLMLRSLCYLDNALVEAFKGAASSISSANFKVLNGDSAVVNLRTGSVLGTAIVKFYLLGVEFWLNLIFYVRDWVLMTFYVFTPVMAWLWAINKNVTAFSVWFGELLTNSLLHAAYALAFCVIATFLSASSNIPWPQKVVGATMLIALGGVLRNLLQDIWTRLSGVQEESVAARALGVLGFGGVLGVHKIAAARVGGIGGSAGLGGGAVSGGTAGGAFGSANLQGAQASGGPLFRQGSTPIPGTVPPIASTVGSQPAVQGGPWFSAPEDSQLPASGGPVPGVGGVSRGGILLPVGASVLQKPSTEPAEKMAGALNVGKVAQGVFQLGAAAFSAPLSIAPGGDQIRKFIVGAAGVAGKAVGTAAGTVGQAHAQARDSSKGRGEALLKTPGLIGSTVREMTGSRSAVVGGLKIAGAAAGEYAMPKMGNYFIRKAASLDGYRHRS